jgi:uncharacterized membrane protein YbhN (UPF0104 family)
MRLFVAVRDAARRHRVAIVIVGSVVAAAIIVATLAGQRHEFSTALSSASIPILIATTALQALALVSRTEAWHLSIEAAGGTVSRRVLFRASSMQVIGGVLNGHLGVAARIAALRRSSPASCPHVPTLIAAEFPILAVEAVLAAGASFTLIAPLGIPWWVPLIAIVVIGLLSAGMRHLAAREARELWRGLAVIRSLGKGSRVVVFVMVAVFSQIFRNWMMLHAVGVDASFLDAIAVLIALVTLSQLPIGPSTGVAASVLILGKDGVAATAAAGVLLTATGTAGGICFLAWAGLDRVVHRVQDRRRARHASKRRLP